MAKKPQPGGGKNTETDPVKERFRAALEKKQGGKGSGSAPSTGSGKHVGPSSANAKTQKMFRRKSGSS